MSDNVKTVTGIYEAFGRGDLGWILDQFADDIMWDEGIRETAVPYLNAGQGKAHAEAFFGALMPNLEFTRFEPGTPCEGGDMVIVPLMEAGRSLATGKLLPDNLSVHVWRFGPDGKAVSFNHVGDWAQHEALL